MDSLTHLTTKLLAERARQGIHQSTTPHIPDTAPPPYTASEEDSSDSDSDSDSDTDDEDPPLNLTINAANTIQGSDNLVPTSPSPLADATKFSALLLHAVNRINNATSSTTTAVDEQRKPRRAVRLALTVNCGVTVVGDRNVVGNVGVRPRTAVGEGRGAEAGAVVGAKRKAEVMPEDDRTQKRPTMEAAGSTTQE